MTSQHERKTKRRFDVPRGDQDEGGSSTPNVVSGRELRPRGQQRAAAADVIEQDIQ